MYCMENMRNAPQWGDLSEGNLEWKGGKTINPQNKYWKGRKKERDFILLHHLMSWAWTGEKIYLFMLPWGAGSVNRWKKGWKIQIPNRKGQGTTELYFQMQWYSGHSRHWAWFLIRFAVGYGWVMQIPSLLEICMQSLRLAAKCSPGTAAQLQLHCRSGTFLHLQTPCSVTYRSLKGATPLASSQTRIWTFRSKEKYIC